MQNKKTKIAIILLAVIVLGGIAFTLAYYWFTYRPAKTREFCDQMTRFNKIAPNEITPYKSFKDCMFKNGVTYP